MEQHKESRFIDDLLDASLAQYCGVEPRPGLESRVLARLRTTPETLPWWIWARRFGVGVVTVGAVVAVVSVRYRPRPHASTTAVESSKPTAATGFGTRGSGFGKGHEPRTPKSESWVSRGVAHPSTSRTTPRGARRRDVLSRVPNPGARTPPSGPRRDVFPSPAPLSEQERLLVSYVRQLPEGASAAYPEDSQALASLRVPDLTIPPLETDKLPSITTDQTK